MGQISGIKIPFLRSHFFLKKFSYLLTLDVDSRKYNMTRCQIHQLQDTLTEIGLHHIDSFLYQKRVQFALFCQHRFAFHKMLYSVTAQYFKNDGTILFRIFCPVNDGSIGCGILLKLQQEFLKVAVGVEFQRTCLITQFFPLGYFLAHLVSLGTNHPKGLVVPCCHHRIFQEFFGSFCMLGTHNCDANISTT